MSEKTLIGVVSSNKMDKTSVVRIERTFRHPIFGKIMRSSIKAYAHDEDNITQIGDKVEIERTRPLSKLKRWRIVRVIK